MRTPRLSAAAALLVAACGGERPIDAPTGDASRESAKTAVKPASDAVGPRWDLKAGGAGTTLALVAVDGSTALELSCPANENALRVAVPDFRAIGSEERLSFGSGGEVVALVADPHGAASRRVSASGVVPDNIKKLIGGPLSASYGAQVSGPHTAPPEDMARTFIIACEKGATAARQAASRPIASTDACLVQDGELLRMSPLRAVGTEPFWGARIEGRCVTYSHPEDQKGKRVWTRFASGPDGGIWTGSLGGTPFVLRTRAERVCSDGMSDKAYSFAVELSVNGEQRRGCAEPL